MMGLIRGLLLLAVEAAAHDLGVTGVQLRIEGGQMRVRVQTHGQQLQGKDPATELPRRLRLRVDGELFAGAGRVVAEDAGGIVAWEAVRAGVPQSIVVEQALFAEDPADRTVVTLLREGEPAGEAVLGAGSSPVVLGETGSAALRRFVPVGIEHILLGADHVAFLLALLLPGGRMRALLAVITAFTLSHSVTLGLAVLGLVQPAAWLVEGVIALSIVAAAGENLLTRGTQGTGARAVYAGGFGLVHGFGFAGALGEVGLPGEVLGWALAGFNVGVEVGQLGIVLVVAPVLARLGRREQVVRYGSLGILAAGVYWTVTRLFGG